MISQTILISTPMLVLLALTRIQSTVAHIRNTCYQEDLPVVILEREVGSGDFTLVKRLSQDESQNFVNDGGFRRLEAQDYIAEHAGKQSDIQEYRPFLRASLADNQVSGLFVSKSQRSLHPNLEDGEENDHSQNETEFELPKLAYEYFYARECTCLSYDLFEDTTIFCPFTASTCREVVDNHYWNQSAYVRETLKCEAPLTKLEEKGSTTILYTLLFVYSTCIMVLFCTHAGRSCLSLLPACLTCGRWNHWQADRLLRRNRELALGMIFHHLRSQHWELEQRAYREFQRQQDERHGNSSRRTSDNGTAGQSDDNTIANREENQAMNTFSSQESKGHPTSLVLRTQTFQKKLSIGGEDNNEDDEEESDSCIICMMPLTDGDRVGLLPCDHLFHVKCLKPWLKRCNACPLCKQKEIAKPRFNPSEQDLTANSETDSDVLSAPPAGSHEETQDAT